MKKSPRWMPVPAQAVGTRVFAGAGRFGRSSGWRASALLFAGLAPALITLGCGGAGAHSERTPIPVSVQEVEKQLRLGQGARYTASITPAAQVEVSFRIAGYVKELRMAPGINGRPRPLQAGDRVRRGDILAELRSDEYAVKVRQAEAQLSEGQSGLAAAKAQLREAQAGLERARDEMTRAKNLFDANSLTVRDYEAAKTQHEIAEARIQGIQAQIAGIEAKLGGARALVEEAQLASDDAILVAPIHGTILKRLAEVGSFVGPGRPVFLIADTESVRASLGVPDLDLAQLRLGTPVSLTAEAVPGRQFQGQVISVAPAADPRTRVFDVEVDLPNKDGLLRIGMICSIILDSDGENPDPLTLIPINSVVRSKSNPGRYAVYVVQDDEGRKTSKLREVELGETLGSRVEVTSGVEVGEQVITAGSGMVEDGDRVRIVSW
jgi:multidrug efflux pump subunit AcrA (membrane-fusion protein)